MTEITTDQQRLRSLQELFLTAVRLRHVDAVRGLLDADFGYIDDVHRVGADEFLGRVKNGAVQLPDRDLTWADEEADEDIFTATFSWVDADETRHNGGGIWSSPAANAKIKISVHKALPAATIA